MEDVTVGVAMDMSGSMRDAAEGARKGFDEFRRDQAMQEGNCWISLTCFDTRLEKPYRAWNARDIPDLTPAVYTPRGMTALYDAYAQTIQDLDQWCRENPWFTGKKVVLVITDGYENSSCEWTQDKVQELTRQKTAEGWGFVVFAANVPKERIAQQLGIPDAQGHQFEANVVDTHHTFAAASYGTRLLRGGQSVSDSYAGGTQSHLDSLRDNASPATCPVCAVIWGPENPTCKCGYDHRGRRASSPRAKR